MDLAFILKDSKMVLFVQDRLLDGLPVIISLWKRKNIYCSGFPAFNFVRLVLQNNMPFKINCSLNT